MALSVETKEEYLTKLEDIANSQQSLIEKVGVLQVDLMNEPDAKLERYLKELSKRLSASFNEINEIHENFKLAE